MPGAYLDGAEPAHAHKCSKNNTFHALQRTKIHALASSDYRGFAP